MRTTIRDRQVLGALRPVDLLAYLRAAGWARTAEMDDRASLWMKGEEDVWVPLRRDLNDFALRTAEILSTLERVEQRSQEEIMRDIASTSADLIRIRALTTEAADGTIPLEVGLGLVEHTREMLDAAACATVAPKPYWARRRPAQAQDFMNHVRMGQTERGSYVLTIVSPVAPVLKDDSQTEAPFERRVTQTLTHALQATLHAAQQAAETADLEPFRKAISQGVSANLCDALSGLGEVSPEHGFEVSVAWSRSRPVSGEAVSTIKIPPDYLPLLREVSRLFKETEPQEDYTLFGVVEKLDRPAGATSGDVTINAAIENRLRKVILSLAGLEYESAIRAHKENIPVACTGELVKDGKSLRLRSPHSFSLLETEGSSL